jgi:dihydroneopterin aldolase
VDTGLLELGRPLGVGAGPLCRPTLCSRCLGSRSVASPTRHLGLGPGTLAALGYESPPRAVGYTVTVRGLVLMCSIGIRRREREQRQRVRISVDLIATAPAAFPGDDRRRVINYEKIVAAIREIARSGHIDLCEGFAERICTACFADTRVERVRVWVEKLDVFSDAEGVGAMLERTRPLSGARDRSP